MAPELNHDRSDAISTEHDAPDKTSNTQSTTESVSTGRSRPSVSDLVVFLVLFSIYVVALTALGVARGGLWLGRQAQSRL